MSVFISTSVPVPAAGRKTASVFAGLAVMLLAGLPARAAESRIIYMVIQAEPTTTMKEVKTKFDLALQATQGCNVREVLVEPIDPQTFTILRAILRRGLGAVKEEQAAREGHFLQPVVGVDSAWSIELGSPFDFIETVTVTLDQRDGEAGAERKITATGSNPAGYSLKLHSPGRYVLSLPKEDSPIAVDIIRDDGTAEPEKRTVGQGWPSVGRAYLVTLSDVIGDESRLFTALQDPDKVSNPIREIQDATKASLMVASFVEVLGNRLRIQDGRITFSFPKPQGVNPKRLWLLFPLTPEELAKEKAALEAVIAEDGSEKLPEILRSNAAADRLAPGRGAGWVELPLAADGFKRVVDLDLAAWQAALAATPGTVGDNALLVYEFENDRGTKQPVRMTEGFIVTDRIAEWLPAVRAAR
jgi:hypothetical protein